MTIEERKEKLAKILGLLQDSGYVYEKSKGGVHGMTQMPPPPGTKMNCESAARVFMQLAKDMGIDGLQAFFFKGGPEGYGYFVPAGGHSALGCGPEISTPQAKGWEFDNHWRVKDPKTGLMYDPTFGTSGSNPEGILGVSMETDKNFKMTTRYGDKYVIERKGLQVTVTQLTQSPPSPRFLVKDAAFVQKQMTNLR